MTTDNLRTHETALNSLELPELTINEGGGKDLKPVSRKLNRAHSMGFQFGVGKPKTAGERLTVSRLEMGLTQEEAVAGVMFRPKSGKRKDRDCMLSRNAYCMYERDLVPMSLNMVEKLAAAFGVSPGWLAFGIGDRYTNKGKRARMKLCNCSVHGLRRQADAASMASVA
jgi:transcriptional regulator with XRE-family HTH domain